MAGGARHLREPPGDHPSAGSIYYLPEVVKWISQKGTEYADFNTCVYADPDKGETRRLTRSRKGSWAAFRDWAGSRLPASAQSTSGTRGWWAPRRPRTQQATVGISASGRNCGGDRGADAEEEGARRQRDARDDPRSRLAGRRRQIREPPGTRQQEGQEGQGEQGGHWWHAATCVVLREGAGPPRRGHGDRPSSSISSPSGSQVRPGRAKGTALRASSSSTWANGGKSWKHMNSEPPPVELLHYETPVNVPLLEAWSRKAKDPDTAVMDWLSEGAPLGRTVAYLRWESSHLRKRTRRPGLRQGRRLRPGRRLATTAPSPTTRRTPRRKCKG